MTTGNGRGAAGGGGVWRGVWTEGGGGGASPMLGCVCVEKWRIWVSFRLQMNEMNDNVWLKIGVKSVVSLYMGKLFEIII